MVIPFFFGAIVCFYLLFFCSQNEAIESDIQNLLAIHDDKLLNISYLKEAKVKVRKT